MNNLEQLIAWYLNTSDPGSATDYLEELVEETNDDNFKSIIATMQATDGYSAVSLLIYLDEIAIPGRRGVLPYLNELETMALHSSYAGLVARLKSRIDPDNPPPYAG